MEWEMWSQRYTAISKEEFIAAARKMMQEVPCPVAGNHDMDPATRCCRRCGIAQDMLALIAETVECFMAVEYGEPEADPSVIAEAR